MIWGKLVANHAFEALESVLAGFAVVKGTLLTLLVGGDEKSFIADLAVFIITCITKRTIINNTGRITAIFIKIDNFPIEAFHTVVSTAVEFNNIAISVIKRTGETYFSIPLKDT